MDGHRPQPQQQRELSAGQVRAVARLTRLQLTDDEVERMRGQLSAILRHFESLAKVDTTGVEPTGHTTDSNSVMRDDVPAPSLDRDQVLSNAPDREGEFFRVRRVLE
jgi:aspartyl-tRNA(Asn)/glutamyl-tRNA(Gln) amidotransferase subunit C